MCKTSFWRAQIQRIGRIHRATPGTGKSTLTTWLAEELGRLCASSCWMYNG